MNNLEISVIVSAYNHERWLERSIRSLLHQEFILPDDFEIIIIDDCSTDNTNKILSKYSDFKNIKLIRNESNMGLPTSVNKAIKSSFGRYIVRVDSDDYVSRKFLFMLKFFLEQNRDYQGVACDYFIVNHNEEIIRKVKHSEEEIACGVMFRRECLFDLGLYNTDFAMREGHEIMQRFKKKFNLAYLELPLYKYRYHQNNRTKDSEKLKIYDDKL